MLLHYVFELYVFIIDCLIVHESAHSTICNIGMRPFCRDAHSCCRYQSPISFGMQRHISCKLTPCLWPWFLVSPCDTAAQWTQRTAKANVQQADLAQGGEAAPIKFRGCESLPTWRIQCKNRETMGSDRELFQKGVALRSRRNASGSPSMAQRRCTFAMSTTPTRCESMAKRRGIAKYSAAWCDVYSFLVECRLCDHHHHHHHHQHKHQHHHRCFHFYNARKFRMCFRRFSTSPFLGRRLYVSKIRWRRRPSKIPSGAMWRSPESWKA